jgi:hypothetical protein
MEYANYLMHFNPNHDPRNGQFAKGHGGSSGRSEDSRAYKYNKPGESGWKGLGRAIGKNISSERGKKVIKSAVIGAALDVGSRFLARQVGHQMVIGARYGYFPAPDLEVMRPFYRLDTMNMSAKRLTINAGKAAIESALFTAGWMKMKDIIKAKKEKRKEEKGDGDT